MPMEVPTDAVKPVEEGTTKTPRQKETPAPDKGDVKRESGRKRKGAAAEEAEDDLPLAKAAATAKVAAAGKPFAVAKAAVTARNLL